MSKGRGVFSFIYYDWGCNNCYSAAKLGSFRACLPGLGLNCKRKKMEANTLQKLHAQASPQSFLLCLTEISSACWELNSSGTQDRQTDIPCTWKISPTTDSDGLPPKYLSARSFSEDQQKNLPRARRH
jgi:hypothetical protein